MKIELGGRHFGGDSPCLIIAEAGINHDGDMEKAKLLIDSASECQADIIKFQTHLPEKEMLSSGPTADYVGDSLFDLLKKVELSVEDHRDLIKHCKKRNILFLSTPYSREAVDLLYDMDVPAYKVGSGEMTNIPLITHIISKGRPMIVSTGMSTMDEIQETVTVLNKASAKYALMHCTSSYPTKYEDVNLGLIKILKEKYGVPVGLSDHSTGIYTALASVALGADIIEKHFTIDRNWPGPDQKSSIEPDELSELVKGVRAVELALGCDKKVIEEEIQVQNMARESVVSIVDIPKDTIVTEEMVWVKRPGTGVPARELDLVIGKRARKDIKADTLIQWGDLS